MAVTSCIQILKPGGTEDDKEGWAGAKIMLGEPRKLIENLKSYSERISKVTRNQIEKVRNIMQNSENRLDEIN